MGPPPQGELGPVLPGAQLDRTPPPHPRQNSRAWLRHFLPQPGPGALLRKNHRADSRAGHPWGTFQGLLLSGCCGEQGWAGEIWARWLPPSLPESSTITTVVWETPATDRPPGFHLPRCPPLLLEERMEPKMPSGGGGLGLGPELRLTLQSSVCMCVHACAACACVHICVCVTSAHARACVHAPVQCVCTCVGVCMCAHMRVCMCVGVGGVCTGS